MSLSFPDCRLFRPAAPLYNERPAGKSLILLLPLIHPDNAHTLQAFLKAYISTFRGQTDVSLVLYMPEPYYDLETLEQWLDAEGTPETQPDIELMLDPMLISAEPELYLNADVVITLEADPEIILKALALNRKMLTFGTLPTDLPFELWVQTISTANIADKIQQLYTHRERSAYSRPWVLEHLQNQLLARSKKRPLIYVPSQRHLAHLGDTCHNYLILSDDFETYVQCLESGLPCLLAQSFLNQERQPFEGDQTSQIARSWHQGQLAIDFHGHNLVEHCQYDLWYTFRGCLHMGTVFEHVYQAYQPTELCLFDEFTQPQFWDPAAGPFPDPKNAVLAFLAEQRGLSWQKLSPPPRGPIRSQSQSHIPETQNNVPEAWFVAPDKLPALKSSYRHVILGIGSHLDLAEQGLLADDLWQREDTLYLFLRTYPFPVDTPSARFADLSFFLSHPELEPEIQVLKQTIQMQWRQFVAAPGPAAESWPVLFANPYLHFQFEYFMNALVDAARHVFAAEQLVKLFKPQLCLLGNGASGTLRSLTASLNQQQVITYRIFHGLQPTAELCSPVSRFLLKGEHTATQILNPSLAAGSVLIGDLRKPRDIRISLPAESELNKLRQHKRQRPLLLLLTSHINYGLYVGEHSLQNQLAYWHQVIALAKQHPEWSFAIKYHPRYDFPALYQQLADHSDNILLLDPGLSYGQLTPFVDICMLVYAFSTVAYEVYASQKPLIFFTALTNPLYAVPLRIRHLENQLEQSLQRLLTDPAYQTQIIEVQNKTLKTLVNSDYEAGYAHLKTYLAQDLEPVASAQPDPEAHAYLQLAHGLTASQLTRNPAHWQQLTANLLRTSESDTIQALCKLYTHYLNSNLR